MSGQPAQVDDADVDKVIDLLLKNYDPALSAETRADLAHDIAFGFARLAYSQTTEEWAQELARKVRQRMLWRNL